MDKKIIILTIGSLLWSLALGIIVFKQSAFIFAMQDNSAGVILSENNSTGTAPVSILFFGDMMLDRNVRKQIIANGPQYPFILIKDFLKGNDIVVANAEGPFTKNKSLTLNKKNGPLTFTFDPTILPTLKELGFTLFGQANNHTLNFGNAGFGFSTSSIKSAGLNYFGDPSNKDVFVYRQNIRHEKVAFIGYNEFAYKGLENILNAIKEAKKDATFIVVYPHWGEEYKLKFTYSQQKTAHSFIDAGADVVIGAHPHVVEPIEIYKNKVIFYSLGNFIFDQNFSGPTSKGLAVRLTLDDATSTYNLFPFNILNQQADLMKGSEKQNELDRLNIKTGGISVSRLQQIQQKDEVKIGDATINVEIADTQAKQIQGLSGRNFLAQDTGMLFVFKYDFNWGIWMKDMNFPIDVLWIDKDFKVCDIVEKMSPASYPKVYLPHDESRYVLELPSGTVAKYKIKIGQDVVFRLR